MLKFSKIYILTAIALICSISLSSCDESIFDYEGDCEVSHIIRFRYDQNLKWADAFPSEVNSVNLYVYDKNGVFVKKYLGRGEELSSKDYFILLDLPADSYKFVAWCGLDNGVGEDKESFSVPEPVAGVSRIEELTCSLNTLRETLEKTRSEIAGYSDAQLYFMYYGYLEETLVDNHDGTKYEYTIELTKDTNHIRIILQDTSGEDLNEADFELSIEDNNAFIEYDNRLRDTGKVTYMPWAKLSDEVIVGKVDMVNGSAELVPVKGVVADFSVSRMMATHNKNMILYIRNSHTKELIAQIPVIEYALLGRDYYEYAYGHSLTEQDLLDREDEYVLTFFMLNHRWIEGEVLIHSWRKVKPDYDAAGAE